MKKTCESCVVKCTPLCKSIETKERELFRTERRTFQNRKESRMSVTKIDWQ